MLNLRFLEAFIWIVRLQSFRAAAEKLNISQATVSSRIASLESTLGCQLFDRNSRELRLTRAGHVLLAHAERLLELQRELRRAIIEQEGVTGTVRIGVVETVVHTILVNFIEALQSTYPDLAFELTAEPTKMLQEHLTRGSIDVALYTDPVQDPNIRHESLGELPMGWVRRRHANQGDAQIASAELIGSPIITFPRGSQPHTAVLEALRTLGATPATLHCVSSIAAITRLVHAGLGIASLPIAAVQEELASGLLVLVAADVKLPALPLVASFRPDPSSHLFELVVATARREMLAFCNKVGPAFARGSHA